MAKVEITKNLGKNAVAAKCGNKRKKIGEPVRLKITIEVTIEGTNRDYLRSEMKLAEEYVDKLLRSGMMQDYGLKSYKSHKITKVEE